MRTSVAAIIAIICVACAAAPVATIRPPIPPTPWAQLDVADAHSLAFAAGNAEHLLFGHHGGLSESRDGGRTWRPLGDASDAMSLAAGDGTTMYIAGHDVFQVSNDAGRSWKAVTSDLPGLDIHAFARSALDPERMWAYLAQGGVYESDDDGAHWTLRFEGHLPFLMAMSVADGTELIGLDPMSGIVSSLDAGKTWTFVSVPPSTPIVSMAGTTDGRTIVLGAADGLYRSDDRAKTWRPVLDVALPLAIGVADDGVVVATVTRSGTFYRSDDGGASWPGP